MIEHIVRQRPIRTRHNQGLSIVGHGERESVSITLTPALSLKGKEVSCLVDELVSQIIERPWGAGLRPVPPIVVRGRLYDSPPLSLGSRRSLSASPNMFRQ